MNHNFITVQATFSVLVAACANNYARIFTTTAVMFVYTYLGIDHYSYSKANFCRVLPWIIAYKRLPHIAAGNARV